MSNKKKLYFITLFQQKSFNNFNYNNILKNLEHLFPIKNNIISVTYKYNKLFSSKIFNYRQLAFSESSESICNCHNIHFSKFINNFHGHVLMGNLNIIKNDNIGFVMGFGTKFRLNTYVKYKNVLCQFEKDLNNFILKTAYKYNIPFEAFTEWKYNFFKSFKSFCKKNLNNKEDDYQTLDKTDIEYINSLKKFLVFVPIDKVANNFAIL